MKADVAEVRRMTPEIVKAVSEYRAELLKAGVPKDEALQLTQSFQSSLLMGLMMSHPPEDWEK